ncbi:hypothetical protein OAJ80_00300 [Candidatus Thioglobus sp.]|nr:hypothetical protein [Candidatus Thioglobus sp.]
MIDITTKNEMITLAMNELKELKELGLTPDDVLTLMKGYEKFTESSDSEKKELMSHIRLLIENQ